MLSAPRKRPQRSSHSLLILFLVFVVIALSATNLVTYFRKVEPERVVVEKIVEKFLPAPPPPLPQTYVPYNAISEADMFNGIHIQTNAEFPVGRNATAEILDKNSYVAEFKVKATVPTAVSNLEGLKALNPSIDKVLPALPDLLATAKISGFYYKMYENKTKRISKDFTLLYKALDRHNFYDIETILELTSPKTKQKALLIQSEMDVNADGSDGDRLPTMDDKIIRSSFYQPFTSYAWTKVTQVPNPLEAIWEERQKKKEEEYKLPGLPAARNKELLSEIASLKSGIADMKKHSFLLGEKDPFVVIPISMLGYPADQFGPAIGDFVAVIYNDKIYPAIIGDGGPSFKMGEASLYLCKELNPKATANIRPEDDLKITYLVFPGTADKPFAAPDLQKWHDKVQGLLDQLGGLGDGVTLFQWQSPF